MHSAAEIVKSYNFLYTLFIHAITAKLYKKCVAFKKPG